MTINIFESAKEKVMPSWAKFTNAGDSAQGTYIGKIVGQIDGYGNEQIIYQLLQDDDTVVNVGFGLNKKVMNNDMATVRFGQIIGFKYKGKIAVKDKFGKTVEVKDFSLFQDPKITNKVWLEENKDNMPQVAQAVAPSAGDTAANKQFESMTAPEANDVPFTSAGSSTNADKLETINKLAVEKLGATPADVKDKVMESLGVAFIPVNYDKIVEVLTAM